jgi:WD40 repeat protein
LWDLAHPVAPASRNVWLDAPDGDGFGEWFTRSGSIIAVETLSGDRVKLFDGTDGHLIRALPHAPGGFPAATFSRDETRFVMTSADIFETPENEAALRIWDVTTGALVVELPLDGATATPVISADGTRVAIPMFGASGQFVQVRDAATGALVAQYGDSDHEVFLTGLAPDGRTLVFFDDAVDILTGAHVPIPAIYQATTEPLFFSADGRRAATITLDHLTVYDVASATVIRTIEFTAQAFAGFLALSPDGSTVAVSNLDGTTVLFDVATGFQFGEPIDQFAGEFVADGSLVSSIAGPQGILVQRFDTTTAAFRLHTCALANRSLSAAEWTRYIGDDTTPRAAC